MNYKTLLELSTKLEHEIDQINEYIENLQSDSPWEVETLKANKKHAEDLYYSLDVIYGCLNKIDWRIL